jgi:endoglucanase
LLFCSCKAQKQEPPAALANIAPVKSLLKDSLSVNQVGFSPAESKSGLMLSGPHSEEMSFTVVDLKGQSVYRGALRKAGTLWQKEAYLADFSTLTRPGTYRIEAGGMTSSEFEIADGIWKKRVDPGKILDSFFAKQRCIEETYPFPKDMDTTHKDVDVKLPVYELKMSEGKVREEPAGRTFADALGGWHDATSTDKETVKIAYSAQMMILAAELGPDYFTEQNRAKLDAEIRWGIEFLFKMQDEDGGVFLAVKPHDWWMKDSLPRRLLANKETGVTARTVSCWATAAAYFRQRDPKFSEKCLSHALKGWAWIEKNPDVFFSSKMYPDYWTGKTSSLLWAECELYLALKESDPQRAGPFLQKAGELLKAASMEEGVWIPTAGVHDPDAVGAAINEQTIPAMCRLLAHLDPELQKKVHIDLQNWAGYWNRQTANPSGFPKNMLTPLFGMNGWASQLALDFLLAGIALDDLRMIGNGKKLIHWIFGANPFATSFVVGFGERDVKNPFKRPYRESIGGVVPGILDADGDGDPEMEGKEEWQTQECCLDYSAALLFDLALMHRLEQEHR